MIHDFLSLSSEEMSSWRAVPATKQFMAYLVYSASVCEDAILTNVRQGNAKEAEILSGKLEAIYEIQRAATNPGQPSLPDQAEDDFRDPAELEET